ncbi:unnamed protein product [Rotaria sp. Silwood1]|nr:unnamed protein product [Rotaria sp. Silwood1]
MYNRAWLGNQLYLAMHILIKVLNVNPNASQKTIENQCRILSRKWHPDRYRDPEEKQKAEATFMNIQQACNRLSNDRKRRQKINTQDLENPN